MALHQLSLTTLAEDLVRIGQSDDRARYTTAKHLARINPIPLQTDTQESWRRP